VLVSRNEFTGLSRIPDIRPAYAVNNMIGLYIKHASNNGSPWKFTFHPDDQEEIRRLYDIYHDRTFLAFVCGNAGICLLKFDQYAAILNPDFATQKTMVLKRPVGGRFRASGPGGNLPSLIPLNRYPVGLFA
jgi:hypothetical protein